ncbi:MAG: beta-ketoacyl synthase N-terminal-like domain-containing protein, partial [Gammaproteobacteria bacterium]
DVETFWRSLVEGVDSATGAPADRWAADAGPVPPGHFLEAVDRFDADFFGIAPEEAAYMSPQQRLLLTHAWKAVEDAGIAPRTLAQSPTGVFIASVPSEYLNAMASVRDVPLVVTGLSTSMIPNRISHSLNLRGPSEHCDTACSSTLVALHRAVQAIRNGECRQALVGAVNLLLTPAGYIGFESMGYLSEKARMAAFEPGASGFVRAEGVGVVLLKPVQQAIADGDHVYAVIRGSGVSHGGSAVSMTTPNGAGMKEAMRQAYEASGIDPASVTYVEAHGIGSPLGDAIELNALKAQYEASADAAAPCRVGSAKPCVGYAEVASGMVSLFKVLMAMRHATLPGIPGFAGLHENISLKNSRLRLEADNQPWEPPRDDNGQAPPRRAAINNYGFSGVNAHLVLEEYRPAPRAAQPPREELVVLSARTSARLQANARQLIAAMERDPALTLGDVAFTLQLGREPMSARLAVVTDDRDALLQALRHYLDGQAAPGEAALFVGSADKKAAARDAERAAQLARAGRLQELAALWVAGGAAPFELLERGPVRRVSLPGQALEEKRFWVEDATGLSALHGARRKPSRRGRVREGREAREAAGVEST